MKLELRPHKGDLFPLGAVLIRSASAEDWLAVLQAMKQPLPAVTVYPIPGLQPNTIWGCLAVGSFNKKQTDIGRNAWCQLVHQCLFIPQGATVYPQISAAETARLFGSRFHFMHPETGLVKLGETIDWAALIELPEQLPATTKTPAAMPFVPMQVRSFQINALSPEETLEQLDEKQVPAQQEFDSKPLNPIEKAKLFVYRQLFKKPKEKPGEEAVRKPGLRSALGKFFKSPGRQQDYEALERRNQKQVDRLLDLLKSNPTEGLKYALPLAEGAPGRGDGGPGALGLQKRWFDFSIFGASKKEGGGRGSGRSASLGSNAYQQLHNQYTSTAQELVKRGEYMKAAFVYLKLLKNYALAASTLEQGELYAEAAAIYLKYLHQTAKAAYCYEKANLILNAIELQKQMGDDEKVGDLYRSIGKKKEAEAYYQKKVDGFLKTDRFVMASLLYREKMENEMEAQAVLLRGWRANYDSYNCLNNYFAHMDDEKKLGEAIQAIYGKDVHLHNRHVFLNVLQTEYARGNTLAPMIRDMAYEIIVEEAKTNPSVVSDLSVFNTGNRQIFRDTLRFTTQARKSL